METSTWHQEKLKSLLDIDYFYRTKVGLRTRKRVLLSQITGTLHDRYAGASWLEMLGNLKKAVPEARARYLSYYDAYKDHLGLALQQHGPDYLVTGGNNRLCTWRFAGKESIMVEVQEYRLDVELRAAAKNLAAQHINIVRLDEHQLQPMGEWKLQLGRLVVKCMTREDVLAFAQAYALLSVQGLDWLWLRLSYRRRLALIGETLSFNWQAGVTQHIPWYQQDYMPYLLAYKMQQELL